MATQPQNLGGASALPLSVMLAAIPSLPRPLLSRLTARMIERMDEMDGDPDIEDDDPLEDNGDAEDNGDREPDCPEARAFYGIARHQPIAPMVIEHQGRKWRVSSL